MNLKDILSLMGLDPGQVQQSAYFCHEREFFVFCFFSSLPSHPHVAFNLKLEAKWHQGSQPDPTTRRGKTEILHVTLFDQQRHLALGLPSCAFLSLHPQVGHVPTTKSSIIRKNGLLLLILPTFVEYLLGADNVLCASPTFDARKSSMIPVLVLS